ncbi:MAG TPA: hypothetical protein VEB42_12805 [Chitinophagaceae bacterium]|nr:hypothetical protein [Chitinophagaceae bacterium]
MARRTIITVIILLAIAALIFWYQQSRDNDDASADVTQSVSVFNRTKNADATTVTASPNDELVYSLKVQNDTDEVVSSYVVETNIEDISELATLIDAQGANYNASTSSLTWTPQDVPANGAIEKQFTVRVKENLPTDSDLLMSARYNNEVLVSVGRGPVAVTPTPAPTPTPYKAPSSGPSAWFAFLLAIAFTAGIVLYRAAKNIQA